MKIRHIVNALPALQKLAGQELSIKKLYKISKLLDNLDREMIFYNEQKGKMLAKYCEVVDNQYMPRQEDMEKLNIEMNELLDTDIEYEVKEVSLGIDENIKLSYNDLTMLKGFVRIGEE